MRLLIITLALTLADISVSIHAPAFAAGGAEVEAIAASAAAISPAGDAAKELAAARFAETAGQHDEAIRILTALLARPRHGASKEARELLGLARERNGQLAQAEAEYEQFLAEYSGGEDVVRVRQRLDAVIAAQNKPLEDMQDAAAAQRQVVEQTAFRLPTRRPVRGGAGIAYAGGDVRTIPNDPPAQPDGWTTRVEGSAGVYFRHGSSWSETFHPFDQTEGKTAKSETSLRDIAGHAHVRSTASTAGFEGAAVASTDLDSNLVPGEDDTASMGQLYLEGNWTSKGLLARLGRQTRYSGGVLGRFDGGLIGYRLGDGGSLTAVAGSPVQRMRDGFNPDEKHFYGLSYEFNLWDPHWTGSLFAIEQRAGSLLDRRAVGWEARFEGETLTGFASIDFDVTFERLNTAIATGTKRFADKSSLALRADYRKSPALFASNALQGQRLNRLDQLLGRYSSDDVAQFALDRSADNYSASLSYSKPLTPHLELYADIYESYMSGMPASGGVDAVPSEGFDTFATAQLIWTGLLRENDLYVGGLRLGHNNHYDQYEVELGAKLPLSDWLRLAPSARLGYRYSDNKSQTELHFEPALGINCSIDRHSSIEIDAGGHFVERDWEPGTEHEKELLLTFGYRYDLYAE